jgi:glycosyltransferase involved in cell wall biosynthesis
MSSGPPLVGRWFVVARIAHVISTPSRVGGAERVLSWIVAGVRARGWDQLVLNAGGDNAALARICSPVDIRGIGSNSALGQLAARRRLPEHLDRFRPDIVHAHLPRAGLLVASLRSRPDVIRLLNHQHGDHFERSGRRLLLAADRLAGRRFDRVVACSEAVRTFLIDRYRYPPDLVEAIRNGWSGPDPPLSRRSHDPTVVCVANLRPQKDHATLVRAFASIRSEVPTAKLLLVGGGPSEKDIRQLIGAVGLAGAVECTGYVDDVWPYLARADVFALTSRHEPLGISVLEAMAAGLPVVATDVGGIPELVRPGENGELVPPGDVGAVARAMLRLLQSPPTRAALGQTGRRIAADHRSERMVDRYLSLYETLLTQRGDGTTRPQRAVTSQRG